MPLTIPWSDPKNRGTLLLLLGFAALVQLVIILIASYYYPINSAYIFVFVSLGVIPLLMGAQIMFAELIYSLRLYYRQKKPTKKKKKIKKISISLSTFIGAGISIGVFVLLYAIFAYALIDPFIFTNIPIYGKFALAEVLTGIITIVVVVIFESAVPKQ